LLLTYTPREIFDSCRSRAENLREQIKSLKSKHNLVQGGVSFPKDLILIEGSEIEQQSWTGLLVSRP